VAVATARHAASGRLLDLLELLDLLDLLGIGILSGLEGCCEHADRSASIYPEPKPDVLVVARV
jgi:hypothetical protein